MVHISIPIPPRGPIYGLTCLIRIIALSHFPRLGKLRIRPYGPKHCIRQSVRTVHTAFALICIAYLFMRMPSLERLSFSWHDRWDEESPRLSRSKNVIFPRNVLVAQIGNFVLTEGNADDNRDGRVLDT
jgi:hypothetical protein